MSETDISLSIRKALAVIGVPSERVQAGRVRVRGGMMHLAGDGTPDIVTPYGWLEVKKPGKKPKPGQDDWHSKWRGFGVRVAVVRSVAEAVRTVREWQAQQAQDASAQWREWFKPHAAEWEKVDDIETALGRGDK